MREEIAINAPPDVVWPYVADPVRIGQWHPKIGSVTPITAGEPRAGARYRIIFRMSRKEQAFNSTIETFQPPVRLVLLHEGDKARRVRETFDLAPASDGRTSLWHEIDLGKAGIPWYWRLVIAFITRFGEPQGDGPLEKLKRQVEADVSTSPQTR